MTQSDTSRRLADAGRTSEGSPADIDRGLLETLVCPVSKQALDYNAARGELVSKAARLAFPIRDGIPVLLLEEARRLADHER